jgi:hypothetical protein
MTQEHTITPLPELVVQWIKECSQPNDPRWQEYEQDIATRAAQWGADQELEACCEWLMLNGYGTAISRFRAARRPKPPSLKEQALSLVEQHEDGWRPSPKDWDTIRRALEQLPDNN